MSLVRTAVTDADPIVLADLKSHLRIVGSQDDAELSAMARAVGEYLEDELDLTLLTTTWIWRGDGFVARRACDDDFWFSEYPTGAPRGTAVLSVPRPPLVSVTSIAYLDTAEAAQSLTGSDYQLDTGSRPGRLAPSVALGAWPATGLSLNAVTITYVAGYGASAGAVPRKLRHLLHLLIGHWWENREAYGLNLTLVPEGFGALVDQYRAIAI